MDILLSAITGGVIGYFTNWLAIKMLFRPLEEKRVFGIKVPFTPGLIPKEKNRIAKNIGVTVEEYLLSPEVIVKSFKEKRGDEKIKLFIEDKLLQIKEQDITISELFLEIPKIKRDVLLGKFKKDGSKILLDIVRGMDLSHTFINVLSKEALNDNNLKNIKKILLSEYDEIIKSEDLKIQIENRLNKILIDINKDERKLKEIVPKILVEDLMNYIDENHKVLAYKFRTLIKEDNIKSKIKSTIKNLVESNVSGLAAAFIPMDIVTEKGYEAVEKYIEGNEASNDLNNILKLLLSNLLDDKIKNISNNLVDTIDTEKIYSYIIALLNGENIKNQIQFIIDNNIENIDFVKIEKILSENIKKILESETTIKYIENILQNILTEIGKVKVNDLIEKLLIDAKLIYFILEKTFDKFIKKDLNLIIKDFKIANIVEETILSFEDEFTEKLILDIASKELKAITILGGVLGMFIGVLNPLIQSLF